MQSRLEIRAPSIPNVGGNRLHIFINDKERFMHALRIDAVADDDFVELEKKRELEAAPLSSRRPGTAFWLNCKLQSEARAGGMTPTTIFPSVSSASGVSTGVHAMRASCAFMTSSFLGWNALDLSRRVRARGPTKR
jgi:hypothetical protein